MKDFICVCVVGFVSGAASAALGYGVDTGAYWGVLTLGLGSYYLGRWVG